MHLITKHSLRHRLLVFLTASLLLAFLVILGLFQAFGYTYFCNSDVYADAQVAKMMWEQKTLFPEGWSFGNQFYVIATPVLAALFYGITGSMNMAMILATEVMTVLIFLSLIWLLRACFKDLLLPLLACLVFTVCVLVPHGPFSLHGMLFFSQASFYACYIITLFFVFGDYIRAFDSPGLRKWHWTVALLLSFATGMQSYRQTVIMVLPILCCELFFAFRRICHHQKPWTKHNCLPLVRAVSYATANLGGLVFMKLLNVPHTSIYGQIKLSSLDQLAEKIRFAFNSFLEITSCDYFLWADPSKFLKLWILFSVLAVMIAAILWLLRIKHQESGLETCWLLCVVGIVGVFLSTIVLDIVLRPIYAFMWFPLVAFSVLIILERLPSILKHSAIFLLCILIAGTFARANIPALKSLASSSCTPEKQMCQWAMDHGYQYLYGDYWKGVPQIAVYADGQVEIGTWHAEVNIFYINPNNNPQDIYGVEENEKALYIFRPDNEEAGLLAAQDVGAEMTKVAEFGVYRAYTSSIPLMKPW